MPSSSISTMTKNSCEEYCCEYRQELATIMYSSYASLEERREKGEGRWEGWKGGREVGGKRVKKITMNEMRGWEGRKRDKQRTRTKMGEMGIDPTSNADKYTETNTHLQMLHWRCGLSAVNVAITE